MESYKSITYFKGLNTLRFFAAFLVVIHHAESMKAKNGFESLGSLSFLQNAAYAVSFFFVLSGFLITYLLLKEKYLTKTISIRTFYEKRIRRIWPLYFLLIFIGTIVLPFVVTHLHIDYKIPYSFGEV